MCAARRLCGKSLSVFGNFIYRPLFPIIFIVLFTVQVNSFASWVTRSNDRLCDEKDQGPPSRRALGRGTFRVGIDANYELASFPT